MASQSEQLEHQSRQTRVRLSQTVEALRDRMTAGQLIDQVADYARYGAQHGPVAEFFRNLGRELRDNPLPLTLIATGVAWLIIASSLSRRIRREIYVVERDGDRGDRGTGFGDRDSQVAIGSRGSEVDWASSRTAQTPAVERAHEG